MFRQRFRKCVARIPECLVIEYFANPRLRILQICVWKSPRPVKKYSSGKNKKDVEKITRKAFAETDERKKISMLCELDGVGIPTASAILTVVYPERYATIDYRSLDELCHRGYSISKHASLKSWIDYLKIVRELSEKHNTTPRKVDMALFAMQKERELKKYY